MILNIQISKNSEESKALLKKVDYTPVYVLDNGRKAENRFELVDMKQLAIDYTNGNTKTSFDASFVGSGSNVTISGGDLQSNIVRYLEL